MIFYIFSNLIIINYKNQFFIFDIIIIMKKSNNILISNSENLFNSIQNNSFLNYDKDFQEILKKYINLKKKINILQLKLIKND
jgi:hypothetical protein